MGYRATKIVWVLLLGFLTSALPTAAQDAGVWLERLQEALGPQDAREALTGLVATASCSGPGGAFETEVVSFRSDWVRFRQSADDFTTEGWSGPDRTWGFGDDGQARDHAPGVRHFFRSHEFHFLVLELATRFSDHRVAGETTVRGTRCTRLSMKDEAQREASVCLSNETRLPVMLEMNPEGAAGPIRVYFEGWKPKAGLQFFHAFDLTEGPERTFRYDYRSIEPNAASGLDFVEPPAPDRRSDHQAILEILRNARRAHLETDAALLTQGIDDELLDISSGAIRSVSRDAVRTRFEEVFKGVAYQRWADLEPPRLKLSDDGTLAWVARRVEVRNSSQVDGETRHGRFTSAYSSTYQKRDGAWKMTSVTSTFLPES